MMTQFSSWRRGRAKERGDVRVERSRTGKKATVITHTLHIHPGHKHTYICTAWIETIGRRLSQTQEISRICTHINIYMPPLWSNAFDGKVWICALTLLEIRFFFTDCAVLRCYQSSCGLECKHGRERSLLCMYSALMPFTSLILMNLAKSFWNFTCRFYLWSLFWNWR